MLVRTGAIQRNSVRVSRHPVLEFAAALAVAVSLALPAAAAPASLPDWDAEKVKKPAPLPDWGVKKGGKDPGGAPKDGAKKPAPLPDWDAAKAKPGPTKPAASKTKKPAKKPTAAPSEAPESEPEPEVEAEMEAEAEAEVEGDPAAAESAEPTTETVAPEPMPEVAAAGVEEAPASAAVEAIRSPPDDRAGLRRAKAELIAGGVLMAVGLGGFGAMTAGVFLKRRSSQDDLEDMMAGANKELRGADTLLAVGAVTGVLGLVMGAALVGEGARDLKAARARRVAALRVAPTFGGLVIRGRF